jgi:hypothetical protein
MCLCTDVMFFQNPPYMASRQLLIPRFAAVDTSFSPLPCQAWHGYGVTSAHRVEVEVGAAPTGLRAHPLRGCRRCAAGGRHLKTILPAMKRVVVTGSALGTIVEMVTAIEASNLVRTNERTALRTKTEARVRARCVTNGGLTQHHCEGAYA